MESAPNVWSAAQRVTMAASAMGEVTELNDIGTATSKLQVAGLIFRSLRVSWSPSGKMLYVGMSGPWVVRGRPTMQ